MRVGSLCQATLVDHITPKTISATPKPTPFRHTGGSRYPETRRDGFGETDVQPSCAPPRGGAHSSPVKSALHNCRSGVGRNPGGRGDSSREKDSVNPGQGLRNGLPADPHLDRPRTGVLIWSDVHGPHNGHPPPRHPPSRPPPIPSRFRPIPAPIPFRTAPKQFRPAPRRPPPTSSAPKRNATEHFSATPTQDGPHLSRTWGDGHSGSVARPKGRGGCGVCAPSSSALRPGPPGPSPAARRAC